MIDILNEESIIKPKTRSLIILDAVFFFSPFWSFRQYIFQHTYGSRISKSF
ncbi:hypothetical protein ASZ90_006253 [hydrocarbon metagenome]|uniref:Uncharacterized protein n=1 Tax=hydrocarbon metagenome TaxID=938273 RepID=A0A0W8FUM5_9ZZZZ